MRNLLIICLIAVGSLLASCSSPNTRTVYTDSTPRYVQPVVTPIIVNRTRPVYVTPVRRTNYITPVRPSRSSYSSSSYSPRRSSFTSSNRSYSRSKR